MRQRFYLAVALAVFLTGIAAASLTLSAGENPKKIRIIYTNDTLGTLEPCG